MPNVSGAYILLWRNSKALKRNCDCTSDCNYLMEMQNQPNLRSVSHIVCTDEETQRYPIAKTMLRPLPMVTEKQSCSLLTKCPEPQTREPKQ